MASIRILRVAVMNVISFWYAFRNGMGENKERIAPCGRKIRGVPMDRRGRRSLHPVPTYDTGCELRF